MGRAYSEPEIESVPNQPSLYRITRTENPDDEFAEKQWLYIDEGLAFMPFAFGNEWVGDKWVAELILKAMLFGRDSITIRRSL